MENFFGEQLKRRRTELDMTQEQLAKCAGVSREAIGNYEAGRRTPPANTAKLIAAALGVPLDWLLENDISYIIFGWFKTFDDLLLTMGYKYGPVDGCDSLCLTRVSDGAVFEVSTAEMNTLQKSIVNFAKFQVQEMIDRISARGGDSNAAKE